MANNTIYQSTNRGVDTEPTTDSNNLITSGAVKAALNDLINDNTYIAPTNIVSGVTLMEGGYCLVGKMVIVNCRFNITTGVSQSDVIARFPPAKNVSSLGSVTLSGNKNHDVGITPYGYLVDSTSGGTGTGAYIVSGVYMSA